MRPPGTADLRVFSIPAGGELLKRQQGLRLGNGLVNQFQVSRDRLIVLPGHIIHGITHQRDNAELYPGVGENGIDGIREAFSPSTHDFMDAGGRATQEQLPRQ